MPLTPDDPRLTAFALGELDESERPEFEALVAQDPEALALVFDIRATASYLTEHLRAEARPIVEPGLLRAIDLRLEPTRVLKPRRRRPWVELAVAASLIGVTAGFLWPMLKPGRKNSELDLAMSTPPTAPERPALHFKSVPSEKLARPDYGKPVAEPMFRQAPAADQAPPAPAPSFIAGPAGQARMQYAPAPMAPASPEPAQQFAFQDTPQAAKDAKASAPAANAPSYYKPEPGTPPPARATVERESLVRARAAGRKADSSAPAGSKPASAAATPPLPHAPQNQARKQKAGEEFRKETHSLDDAMVINGLARSGDLSPKDFPKDFKEMADRRRSMEQPDAKKSKPAQLGVAQDAEVRREQADGEGLAPIVDNSFRPVNPEDPSTFSIDCDTASYTHVRRILNQGAIPPKDAVRIEEMINYFPYSYPPPQGDNPFSVNVEVARCPWDGEHRLVRIGLKGKEIVSRPPSNLVFLIDVSGSMDQLDKLPMLKAGMKMMVDSLGENDRVAIVVYASREGLVLSSTSCINKAEIVDSLDRLQAGGSTNGGSGIALAYDVAAQSFIKGGTNRVLLCTDGDFNVGVTEGPDLDALIDRKKESGVFLSVLAFGQGNVKHDRLERLADRGNGEYYYIDSIKEARRVLVERLGSTLMTIAKDVKIQVKFNPAKVASYRLIGYENRVLAARDFNDDRKDAGEIGASHCVTALYEVIPPGQGVQLAKASDAPKVEMLNVDLRCKAPDGEVSKLLQCPADDDGRDFAAASVDFKFASSVAGFGMLLRDSPYKGNLTWPGLLELATGGVGADPTGYRKEFLDLVRKAQSASTR